MVKNLKGLIPEIINNFHLYKGIKDGSERMIGVTGEVALPDLANMTETISGSGMLGEFEIANPGHFSNIDMEIPFIGLCNDMLHFTETETTMLAMRMTQQSTVKDTRTKDYTGLKVVVGGTKKGMKLGTVKIGGQMGSSVTLSLNYICISIGDYKLFELDKINEIYVVDNKDQLAEIRKYC